MTGVYWLISGLVFVVGVFWVVSTPPTIETPTERTGRVSYVIDGDTFILKGNRQRIRLWGVDAPESDHRGGNASTSYLNALTHGQNVICKQIDVDRYGRSVARCFLPDGREINRLMIDSPHAKEYRRFSKGFYERH